MRNAKTGYYASVYSPCNSRQRFPGRDRIVSAKQTWGHSGVSGEKQQTERNRMFRSTWVRLSRALGPSAQTILSRALFYQRARSLCRRR